jgi:hypothetical protein
MNVVRADIIEDPEAEDLPVEIFMGNAQVCNSRCLIIIIAESFKAKLVDRFSHTVEWHEQKE